MKHNSLKARCTVSAKRVKRMRSLFRRMQVVEKSKNFALRSKLNDKISVMRIEQELNK